MRPPRTLAGTVSLWYAGLELGYQVNCNCGLPSHQASTLLAESAGEIAARILTDHAGRDDA